MANGKNNIGGVADNFTSRPYHGKSSSWRNSCYSCGRSHTLVIFFLFILYLFIYLFQLARIVQEFVYLFSPTSEFENLFPIISEHKNLFCYLICKFMFSYLICEFIFSNNWRIFTFVFNYYWRNCKFTFNRFVKIYISFSLFRGLEAIVVDYARPIIMGTVLPKILHLLLSFLSVVTLAGLIVLIYNGPGISKTVKNVWNIGKEEVAQK